MSICEKPARQMNLLLNKNRPAESCLNKKIFLQHCIFLLFACLPLVQLNAQSSIYKNGCIDFNNGIHAFIYTFFTLLRVPLRNDSDRKKNQFLQAGNITCRGAGDLGYKNAYTLILYKTCYQSQGRFLACYKKYFN
jgi:hypothetical protein